MPEKRMIKKPKIKTGKLYELGPLLSQIYLYFEKNSGATKYTKNGVKISANKTKKVKLKKLP